MTKNTITSLREALLDELINQIENGPTVVDKDTGELVRVSPPASLLGVAAKVVKDFAHEIDDGSAEALKAQKLADYLAKRTMPRQGAVPN